MIVVNPRDIDLTYTNVPLTDHAEWAVGTTYAEGAKVIVLDDKRIYESLQAANTGKTPSTSPEWWFDLGSMNAYKMFDEFVNTQTVNTDQIHIKLELSRSDYVAFFGVDGVEIELKLWDITETTLVWETTLDLTYGASVVDVSDWYEYFFGEYDTKEDFSLALGAILFEGVLEVKIIADTGQDAKCGKMIVGRQRRIGLTRYGASAGLLDFSKKLTDDFGRTYLKQGSWAKRNSCEIIIDNSQLDAAYRTLASLRGTATAWITDSRDDEDGRFESLLVYGFCRDFNVVVDYPTISVCRMELEGMI